jgi:hypothetical protein
MCRKKSSRLGLVASTRLGKLTWRVGARSYYSYECWCVDARCEVRVAGCGAERPWKIESSSLPGARLSGLLLFGSTNHRPSTSLIMQLLWYNGAPKDARLIRCLGSSLSPAVFACLVLSLLAVSRYSDRTLGPQSQLLSVTSLQESALK